MSLFNDLVDFLNEEYESRVWLFYCNISISCLIGFYSSSILIVIVYLYAIFIFGFIQWLRWLKKRRGSRKWD